jgi:hypothetical protein
MLTDGFLSMVLLAGLVISGPDASAERVLMRLAPLAGESVTLAIVQGGRAEVSSADGARTALSPTLREDGSLDLVLSIAQIDAKVGATTWLPVENLRLQHQESVQRTLAGQQFELSWLGMAAPAGTEMVRAASDSKGCCVYCGGFEYCGCRVDAPCGSCCRADLGCCELVGRPATSMEESAMLVCTAPSRSPRK